MDATPVFSSLPPSKQTPHQLESSRIGLILQVLLGECNGSERSQISQLKRGNPALREDWVLISVFVSAEDYLSGRKETTGSAGLGRSGGLARSLIYLYLFYIYAQQAKLLRNVHCAYILNIITLVSTFPLPIKHDWSTINMEM